MANKFIIICICAMLASSVLFVEAGNHGHGSELASLLAAGILTIMFRDGPGALRSSGGYGHAPVFGGPNFGGYGHGMGGYGGYGHGMGGYGHGMGGYVLGHPIAKYANNMPLSDADALMLGLGKPLELVSL